MAEHLQKHTPYATNSIKYVNGYIQILFLINTVLTIFTVIKKYGLYFPILPHWIRNTHLCSQIAGTGKKRLFMRIPNAMTIIVWCFSASTLTQLPIPSFPVRLKSRSHKSKRKDLSRSCSVGRDYIGSSLGVYRCRAICDVLDCPSKSLTPNRFHHASPFYHFCKF